MPDMLAAMSIDVVVTALRYLVQVAKYGGAGLAVSTITRPWAQGTIGSPSAGASSGVNGSAAPRPNSMNHSSSLNSLSHFFSFMSLLR